MATCSRLWNATAFCVETCEHLWKFAAALKFAQGWHRCHILLVVFSCRGRSRYILQQCQCLAVQFSFMLPNVLRKFVLCVDTFALCSYFLGRSIKSSSASSSSSSASASYRRRHPRRPHRRHEHHHHHHDRRYQHPIIIAISIIINAFVVFLAQRFLHAQRCSTPDLVLCRL